LCEIPIKNFILENRKRVPKAPPRSSKIFGEGAESDGREVKKRE
jgi:hypothetical protein